MKAKRITSIAIFGGTFDPPHFGHLNTAVFLQKKFHFDQFLFLPNRDALLKEQAQASGEHRLKMLQLAVECYPHCNIDLREINKPTPSYMVDTLKSFREESPKASLVLILGQDAFNTLPKWHQWKQLVEIAHLLVIERAGVENLITDPELNELLSKHETRDCNTLLQKKSGCIFRINAGHYEIASSNVRKMITNGTITGKEIPEEVLDYIKEKGLYL